jgi:hypothetical protein
MKSTAMRTVTATICLALMLALPYLAEGAPPSYYMDSGGGNLGGRAKLLSRTVSGMLQAYDIFHQAMGDSGANADPAINLCYAAARIANIVLRDDGSSNSLVSLAKEYGVTYTGDSFNPDAANFVRAKLPLDYQGSFILPSDAPYTENVRSFLATTLLQEVNGALDNLALITSPSFKTIIPAAEVESDLNLEVDYGDVLLFRAGLKALKAAVLIATAYDLNVDPRWLVAGYNSKTGTAKAALDHLLDLLKLLPTTSTPTGNGLTQLSQAKTLLVAAIDDYNLASAAIRGDTSHTPGAEELIEVDECQLRTEQAFRDQLTELERSLQATQPAAQVANVLMNQQESWDITDASDSTKIMRIKFGFDRDKMLFATRGSSRFIAWRGDVDCVTGSGNNHVIYLKFDEWIYDGSYGLSYCDGEATLNATATGNQLSGTYSVTYYGSIPSCSGTVNGSFSGTRQVSERRAKVNLNPLLAGSFSLRDLLPEFDSYGMPVPGTVGHGRGNDATLGGSYISYTKDNLEQPITQNYWTDLFAYQPATNLATIRGTLTCSSFDQTGILNVGVYDASKPVGPDSFTVGTTYIGTEVANGLAYEIKGVPKNQPLLIVAKWDRDMDGIASAGDLEGGYTTSPTTTPTTPLTITSDLTTGLNITLGQAAFVQVRGTVTYSYSATGERNLVIWGSTTPAFTEHYVLFSQAVAPGTNLEVDYSLSGLPLTRNYLYFFIDVNGNGQPDLGEPFAFQGYYPPVSNMPYDVVLLNLQAQPYFEGVNVKLAPATLTPLWLNVHHEQRPEGSFLVACYIPYAPFTAISSVLVSGDGLVGSVNITSAIDEFYEYWYMIPAGVFTGGVIPTGQHTYTVSVQPLVGSLAQFADTPNINPLSMPTVVGPANSALVTGTPTFAWNTVAGADRYRVEIYDLQGHSVYQEVTTSLSLTLPAGVLSPGVSYNWRVRAFRADNPADPLGSYSNRSGTAWRRLTVGVSTVTGDLDGDGDAGLADSIIALQVLAGLFPESLREDYVTSGVDVDGDNSVGLAEALYPLQRAAGLRSNYHFTNRYVQFRKYPGSTQYRVWLEVVDADGKPGGDVLSSVQLLDPNGASLPFSSFSYSPEVDYSAQYNPNTQTWNEDLNGVAVAGYFGRINATSLQPGTYTFTAVDNEGTAIPNGTFAFTGDDPNVVVVDSSTISQSWGGDGSLTLNWTLPANSLDPSQWHVDVLIEVMQGGQYANYYYYGRVPLDLVPQHIDISAAMMNKLKSFGDELRCIIRVKKNDSTNRGYSSEIVLWTHGAYPSLYHINYTYVQYRLYEDGSVRRQIWMELKDDSGNYPSNVLKSLELRDSAGQLLALSPSPPAFYPETDYVAQDTGAGWQEDLIGLSYTGYWATVATSSLKPDNYQFAVVDTSDLAPGPWSFTFSGEQLNVPVVKSSTVNPTWQADGGLGITWTLPAEAQLLNPTAWRVEVYIGVFQSGIDTGQCYFGRVPLNVPQQVTLSAGMVNKLKSLGDELRCYIRVRKNDNAIRSYSNTITLWKKSP